MNKVWLVMRASLFGLLGGEVPPVPPVNRNRPVARAQVEGPRANGPQIEGVSQLTSEFYVCKSLPEAEEAANTLLRNSPREKYLIFESVGLCETQLTPTIFKTWDVNGEITIR